MGPVLIVDDSPTFRTVLAYTLRQALGPSAAIHEAGSVAEALSLYRAARPELVFLDMELEEGRSGLDVLDGVARAGGDAKVVILTSFSAGHPKVVAAMHRGAVAHVQKPASTEYVRELLNDLRRAAQGFGIAR